jgi:hypothetical protein
MMQKLTDLTGKKFGRWTVLQYVEHGMWKCKCSCGVQLSVYSTNLKSGHSKSCGCLSKEVHSKLLKGTKAPNFKDITGQVFSRLTVQKRDIKNKNRCAVWLCLCSCGNTVKAVGKDLRYGHVQSCGCLYKDTRPVVEDLTGHTFGRLTVLRQGAYYVHKHGKQVKWVCKCSCGSVTTVKALQLKNGHTQSCGCLLAEARHVNGKKNTTHGYTVGGSPSKLYSMWSHAKGRAKRDFLAFNIELSDIVVPEECPALGIPLKYSTKIVSPNSPSLDKIIPSLGYVKGNVRVISQRANSIKRDATLGELEALVQWLRKETQHYESKSTFGRPRIGCNKKP